MGVDLERGSEGLDSVITEKKLKELYLERRLHRWEIRPSNM